MILKYYDYTYTVRPNEIKAIRKFRDANEYKYSFSFHNDWYYIDEESYLRLEELFK